MELNACKIFLVISMCSVAVCLQADASENMFLSTMQKNTKESLNNLSFNPALKYGSG